MVATLSALQPDVVALQELSPAGADQLDAALSEEFPFRAFPRPTQGGGLALASRFPLHDVRYRGSQYGGNGFLLADVDVDGRRIQLANLHLDPLKTWTWGLRFSLPWQLMRHGSVHRRELGQVHAELRPGVPTLIVGDFNSYASDAAPDWLRDRGYVDSLASQVEDADDLETHHFTAAGIDWGDRIDFIFHTPDLRTLDSRIVGGRPSDHDIVVSTLEWADPPRSDEPSRTDQGAGESPQAR
jgi:endonuclease/exonuclease/phosphatase family metal-dependent hydrolase